MIFFVVEIDKKVGSIKAVMVKSIIDSVEHFDIAM